MRIVVVGAGAMGGLFGALLWSSGHDVLLYDIWSEHVDAIRTSGLAVEDERGTVSRFRVPATDAMPAAISGAELLLVEVKSYDTFEALHGMRNLVPEDSFVLSLQNGIGNYEELQRALPDHQRLIIGTTAHGSNVLGPGRIRRTGRGPTEIGDPAGIDAHQYGLEAIALAFSEAGVEMRVAEQVESAIWAKLAANAAINPLTALTGLRNGELPGDEDLVATYTVIVRELVAIMQRLEIPPAKDDFVAYAEYVMDGTFQSYSSMLQDIRLRRRTEIDAINGAIGRFGRQVGVQTPVNDMIAALVRNRQRDYLEEGREAF